MASKYKLSYTATEVNNRLKMVGQFSEEINNLSNEIDQLTYEDVYAMPNVPVTTSDNGKFLCVVNGSWAATSVNNADKIKY